MSSSATSRPKAKYSSMVPVPTVARVWPCRSPQKVLGSPGRTARIRLDAATWSPRAAVMRASAPAAVSARPVSRVAASSPLLHATRAGSPATGAPSAPSRTSPVNRSQGLPQASSALTSASNGSPGAHRRGGRDDEPVEVAAHHVDHRRGVEHRVQLGAEGIHEEPELTAALAERLGARAGAAAAPVADGHVDAVAGIERAVGHRDHEALEPRPHLAARLEGERGHRRLARRLEPHRAVFGGARVGELRLAPVGGEARGDLDARPLVVAVGADLVGDGPRAERARDDGLGGRDPRPPDVPGIRLDRHRGVRSARRLRPLPAPHHRLGIERRHRMGLTTRLPGLPARKRSTLSTAARRPSRMTSGVCPALWGEQITLGSAAIASPGASGS